MCAQEALDSRNLNSQRKTRIKSDPTGMITTAGAGYGRADATVPAAPPPLGRSSITVGQSVDIEDDPQELDIANRKRPLRQNNKIDGGFSCLHHPPAVGG